MPRKNRSDLPDGFFHVIAHAVADKALFEDDVDRRLYLDHLHAAAQRYRWKVHSFVLMTNHVHMLVEAEVSALSQGLWWLHWRYDVHFKRRHPDRRGHILEQRPKTIPITDDRYMVAVLRYIALNPVKAGMVESAEEYRWSAHRAIAGLGPGLPLIEAARPWEWFGSAPGARERYERFVTGEEPPEEQEVARWAERPPADRPPLTDIVQPGCDDSALRLAFERWRYSLRQIAEAAGIGRTALSRRLR